MAFEGLSGKLNQVFKKLKSHGKLTESDVKAAMREVRMALLEADVSYKVVKDFVQKVSERAVGEEVLNSLTPAQQVIKIVNEELCSLMGNENARINFPSKPPCVIMMCGLQGSGKTTSRCCTPAPAWAMALMTSCWNTVRCMRISTAPRCSKEGRGICFLSFGVFYPMQSPAGKKWWECCSLPSSERGSPCLCRCSSVRQWTAWRGRTR